MKNAKRIDSFSDLKQIPVFDEPVRDFIKLSNDDRYLINVCKKIRIAAKSRNVRIDNTQHRLSDNLHLFRFIELCGYSVEQFVLNYLSFLQPVSLVIDQSQSHKEDKIIYVVELSYKYSLYIKLDLTQFNEIEISFHEDQMRRNYSAIGRSDRSFYLSDACGVDGQEELIECTIAVGFAIIKRRIRALCIEKNIYLVDRNEISLVLLNFANTQLKSFTSEEELSSYFSKTDAISFTSYGNHELNDISMLIDYIVDSDNEVDRATAALVLSARVKGICDSDEFQDIKNALFRRYSGKLANNASAEISILKTLF